VLLLLFLLLQKEVISIHRIKLVVAMACVAVLGQACSGAFSNTLACKRASVIRGIAPIAGWGPGSAPTSGTPSCPTASGHTAVMGMHGTQDGTIPISIGQASATFWRMANGCTGTTSTSTAYPSCVGYQGCPAGSEVFFCTHAGDHQVPANAGANLWKFFSSLP
jgi:polyhydroxybutyrate depolymerase